MDNKTKQEINSLKKYNPNLSAHRLAGKTENKTSRYRGVCFMAKKKRWRAQIKEPDKRNSTYLGSFEDEETAAKAYNIAAKAMYGDDAFQNEIKE